MAGRFVVDFQWTPMPSVVAQGYFITAEMLQRLEEPLERSSEILSDAIAENFATESSGGERWAELADSTKIRKASQDLDPRILHATLALSEGASDVGTWDISQDATNEAVAALADPTGYGEAHVIPWPRPEGGYLKQRDWTYISDETMDEVEEAFYEWLEEAIRAGA